MSGTLFAVGYGYVAEKLARRLMPERWRVIGTTRSRDKAARMSAEGVEPVLLERGNTFEPPAGACWLVSTPVRDGICPGVTAFGASAPSADWIGYLSTTAVYGDKRGGWVLENTPVSPTSPRGEDRVTAEEAWRASGGPVEIIRLPGIYGPGRSVLDQLRSDKARRIDKPGQVFSRIHVDDIASGLAAAMQRPGAGRVLHLCDDWPCAPGDPVAFGAELLDMAPPPLIPFDDADLSEMARSFYSECKRVGNGMTKAALDWRPQYPTYREGLRAILEAETG